MTSDEAFGHRPVLLEEVLRLLAPERGGLFVDCTVGLGGHADAILSREETSRLVGLDRDPEALEIAGARLERFGDRVRLVETEFHLVSEVLAELGDGRVAGLLADLGVSSLQLDRPDRGFSFRHDGPLDMRMGKSGETASDLVNEWEEGELARIFREYGEERMARRVARAVVRARPLATTSELRQVVHRAKGRAREGGIDAATRVFQALRIEVNHELEGLSRLLDRAIDLLADDGRLVVISYQSLEDRLVKRALRDRATAERDPITGRERLETRVVELLTRRPIRATTEEIEENPRARSAKLRAGRRL